MLNRLYKFLILLIVFFISLYYFGRDIKEEDHENVQETIEMGETTYPIVSILMGDTVINQLHGYSSNVASRMNRESITPLDANQNLTVLITENDYEIKRVDYELYSIYDDKVMESDNIKALEKEDQYKIAKIRFKSELKEEQEYYARITLVTSKSKKINYYTRIKSIDDGNQKEKIDYVMYFHNATLNNDNSITDYLELTDKNLTSLSYVNINSAYEYITWGGLEPEVISNVVPVIKEISKEFASIELKYTISAQTETGTEFYYVKEFYRVRYSPSRMYLLNYERTMESFFNIDQIETITNDIKLGITNNGPDMDLVSSSDQMKLSFVLNRELWYFNRVNQTGVKVFSFRQDESDYIRDTYDNHNVQIINMDDDGNIDFLVYGYMNRGAYEGYVGMVLYRFYSLDNRIEELTYIPIDTPYQFLKEMVEDFNYVSQLETFYFHLNDTVYGYNLITKKLTEIASNIDMDSFIFSREGQYIAWEDKSDSADNKKIIVYHLETEEKVEIDAKGGSLIKLLGTIGSDFIYGNIDEEDVIITLEGSKILPMNQIIISDSGGKTLKEYRKEGYVVTDIQVNKNIITLERATLSYSNGEASLSPAEDDKIINNMDLNDTDFTVEMETSDIAKEEWHISLPEISSEENGEKNNYKYFETLNTIVSEDTTLRLEKEIGYPGSFIVYALGDIKGIYKNAGEAIRIADESVGLVFNLNQQLVWERGDTRSSNTLSNILSLSSADYNDSLSASAGMLIKYKFNNIQIPTVKSGTELLEEFFQESLVNLTGATLEKALYFVSKGRPVIAKTSNHTYVIISGYDSNSITIIDPIQGKQQKNNLQAAKQLFESMGNVFISYAEYEILP